MVDEPKRQSDPYRYIALAQVGVEMVAPIVIGVLLDNWLGWMPWLTIVGAIVGLGGGLMHLQAMANQAKNPPGGSEGEQT